MSPFVLLVADLVGREVLPRLETVEASVDWSIQLSSVQEQPPLVAELSIQAVTDGLLVRGPVRFTARHVCAGCLESYEEAHVVHVAALFEADPEQDGEYPIDGDRIDVEQLVRDEVLLAMPLLPDCGTGCRGVVTSPESDLNAVTPGDGADSGSPFAVLRELFDAGD